MNVISSTGKTLFHAETMSCIFVIFILKFLKLKITSFRDGC
ncbi:hypothetical protein PBCV1_a481aL [Paramecium bursaria Chlorella virus 1]|uniref:Uncharacterized protein n=1 Tax=Paramecium bursaria Chlorella virus 1 TaxID=10506 RepID=F8TU46_PBCV1|nr:hypothetical protein PBCV1_a481aL [Paramecium bursaria Chlorella virus 1]AEI70107.1 hypothetical protein [Paramecium bursaria Chlorella virus 1]